MSSTTAPNTQIIWSSLPPDVIAHILLFYANAMIGSDYGMKTTKNHMYQLVTANSTFATAAKPIAAIFSPPSMKGHGEQLVKSILLNVFFTCKHWGRVNSHARVIMYTCVYLGATQKPPLNQSRKYYNLLGRTLTNLVREGTIPWKEMSEIQEEIKSLKYIFKYLDRFYVFNFQLPPIQKLIEEAYLAGNPNLEEFTYYDPGPPIPRSVVVGEQLYDED